MVHGRLCVGLRPRAPRAAFSPPPPHARPHPTPNRAGDEHPHRFTVEPALWTYDADKTRANVIVSGASTSYTLVDSSRRWTASAAAAKALLAASGITRFQLEGGRVFSAADADAPAAFSIGLAAALEELFEERDGSPPGLFSIGSLFERAAERFGIACLPC